MASLAATRAKQLLDDSILPGDIVAGIIGASGLQSLPSNELFLAAVFFQFAQEKPKLFEDFDFFPGGTYPFTDVLQEQLSHFETEHLLGKPNPTYKRHEVKVAAEGASKWMRKWVLDKLSRAGMLQDIEELGRKLRGYAEDYELRHRDSTESQVPA